MDSVGRYRFKERRGSLLDVPDINLKLVCSVSLQLSTADTHFRRMQTTSDGERRRFGFVWSDRYLGCPVDSTRCVAKVLCRFVSSSLTFRGLSEQVTVDLDVLAFFSLLKFLKREANERVVITDCQCSPYSDAPYER